MKTKISRLFIVGIQVVLCVVAAPSADQMVNIGTHSLQMHCDGAGSPAIVFDSGIANDMDNLRPLLERLAKETRVFIYNRAGYGRSEPGPLPRHCRREAEELKALLDSSSVAGPYIVVGHSLGALNMQAFAAAYPEDVVGIVLLDPPPLSFIRGEEYADLLAMAEGMTEEWQSIANNGIESENADERNRASFFRMIASEHREMFGASAKSVSDITSFGQTPLLVMAAGIPNSAFGDIADEYQRYWIEQNRALSHKSSNGMFVLAKESTHHLYVDVPDQVVERILAMVKQVRQPQ